MSATSFNVDMRDIHFVLFEQIRLQKQLAGIERYQEFDLDTYKAILDEACRVSGEALWPANGPGDQEGCTLDDQGNVKTPSGYGEAWKALCEGGWVALTASPELGGIGLPPAVGIAAGEMMTGANSAFMMYSGLSRAAANLLVEYGDDWMRETVVPELLNGRWGGTMCLTEPGAGSAVGDNRTRAKPTDEDGVYLLEGEKIFISCGDSDFTENIIHLVLARTEGAPEGTAGLSIFIVPKFDLGSGERNGAFVVGLEEKMGIHGSATCTVALGATQDCRGHLIGKEGDGMRVMFHMMNESRIGVGLQALASASAAYLNALGYAKERVQGTRLSDMANAEAERVAIVQHPDVRRMLMRMKVITETLRSLIYDTAARLSLAELASDESERARHLGHVELMTPICKSLGSDWGFDVTVMALQTFGGYGYIGEYPVEQHLRDCKIASIYEGTNGIQAMDLLGRKMRQSGGALFMNWVQEATQALESAREFFPEEVEALEKQRDLLVGVAMHLAGVGASGNIDGAMFNACSFLEQFGTVILGLHACEQARLAREALAGGSVNGDESFYRGKLLNLRFYVNQILPKATSLAAQIQSGDESALDEVLFA